MIYLASASPRRHEILRQMGVAHRVLDVPAPPGEDEPRLPGEAPQAYVRRTAREKALRALHWLGLPGHEGHPAWPRSGQPWPPCPVLAADTTVILGDDILGKPVDAADAARMLRRLSGREHEVHTAVVLALPGDASDGETGPGAAACPSPLREDVSITRVRFAPLSEDDIAAYCATGQAMGKAGAYGIQGAAAVFVEHLAGSHSGVVGLPIFETHRLLRRAGLA